MMLVTPPLASAVLVLASPAVRQEQDDIVVTGERISRTVHDTASSVAIETSATIATQSAPDRIEQLLALVPNVQLGSGGEGPTIRGQDSTGVIRDLPAFLSGTRPRATIRIDGRSATYYELAFGLTSVWDVGRVEVFRSPQTTTQGRNSIGGAIFVETRDPEFAWEGQVRGIAGDYDTWQAAGVVSGPIIADQLAFRVSGDLRRSRTSSKLTSAAADIDANRDESELVRLKLVARPNGLADTRFSLTYSHGRSQMPQIEGIEPPYLDRRDANATYGIFEIKVDSITGRLDYEPPGSLAAHITASYGKADVRRHAPPGFGEAKIAARDFSIEPVVSWRPGPRLSVTGGMNYTRATQKQTIDLTTQTQVRGTGQFDDVQNSLGIFAQADLSLTDSLTLTGGLRYQHDRQLRQGGLSGSALTLPLDYQSKFDAWLPKLSLAWEITPDIRIGWLAQRAFNPGGVNLNTSRGRIERFTAERMWDFELFARARLADGKVTLAANVFRYEMFDAQRTQTSVVIQADGRPATSATVANAPRAWTMGLEMELNWRPSPRFQLRGSIGLLDTRITRTLDPVDPILGKQFQRSPHFSGSASVVWTPTPALTLSAQMRGTSSYFSDDLETATRRIGGSATVDARAAWTLRGVTVFGYARNLLDSFHLTYKFSSGLATAGDPREVGVGIEARF